ncbi:MAG: DUF2007 domain-containing protein [Bryobacteraceae bacterium]|jgi:hypothetical protein
MAQDREPTPATGDERIRTTADLDLVSLFDSSTVDSEIEADVIVGVLEASGIEAVINDTVFPNLAFTVKVPREQLAEAQRLLAEALAAGPEAADQAEAESEGR